MKKKQLNTVALADKFRDMFDKLLQKGFTTDQAFGLLLIIAKNHKF